MNDSLVELSVDDRVLCQLYHKAFSRYYDEQFVATIVSITAATILTGPRFEVRNEDRGTLVLESKEVLKRLKPVDEKLSA